MPTCVTGLTCQRVPQSSRYLQWPDDVKRNVIKSTVTRQEGLRQSSGMADYFAVVVSHAYLGPTADTLVHAWSYIACIRSCCVTLMPGWLRSCRE